MTEEMETQGPLRLTYCTIPTEWLDYNGHMNDATYAIPFSHAIDSFMEYLGMDAAYRSAHQQTIFTLESHTRFLREVFVDERLSVSVQLIDHDKKRAHVFLRLLDEKDETRATCEQMLMVINTAARRPGQFSGRPADRLEALSEKHKRLPIPDGCGCRVGIP